MTKNILVELDRMVSESHEAILNINEHNDVVLVNGDRAMTSDEVVLETMKKLATKNSLEYEVGKLKGYEEVVAGLHEYGNAKDDRSFKTMAHDFAAELHSKLMRMTGDDAVDGDCVHNTVARTMAEVEIELNKLNANE